MALIMITRTPAEEPDRIPEEARRELVSSFFADGRSMVTGSIMTTVSGFVVAWVMQSWLAFLATVGVVVSTAIRVKLFKNHKSRVASHGAEETSRYELVYILGVCGYLICNGLITFSAYLGSSNAFVLVLALFMALTNSFGIAVRNFAVGYGVSWQIAMIAIPLAASFAVAAGPFLLMIALLPPLFLYIYSSAARLREILTSEMAYRRRSDSIADQFDFAINNMSHGMCMISADLKIQVSNGRFAEFFGLPATRKLKDVRFKALLRLGARRGRLSIHDAQSWLAGLVKPLIADEETSMQIETPGGGVCDLTIKHNANGGWVVVVQDVTEKRQAERVIDHMARFDAVTNLYNRRSFELALTQALADARASGTKMEVLFLDLDGFKQVNDTLGHKTGDRVLAEAARRLSTIAGERNLIARWGGDEFVILRRASFEQDSVESFAERVIAELSRPSAIDGTEVVVGASVGISIADTGEPSMDLILQQADMALYAAKRESRGRYRIYEEAMSESARERRLLELDLQSALAARSFDLHYQPIVNLQTKEVVSFEALARWRHPTRGQVSPGLFVPVLEDLNLMQLFGGWALQRACEDAVHWPDHVKVGVNVSAKQLESDTLYDSVVRALDRSGLSPTRLELEITETALLRRADIVEKTLERVRALGVRIALDDFGTGYSSLSHLMGLPLDKVKIDQSFTRKLGVDRKADVVIENIARLSSQLGMVVTVEGIETRNQLDRVRSLGAIAEGQGYLFSKALPYNEVLALFAEAERQSVA